MSVWYMLNQGPMPGSFNMALDEYLLTHQLSPVLRLYQWECPTLSLGFSQKLDRHVNIQAALERGVPVVRRLTGGKAVLHSSEITYSVTGSMDTAPFDRDLLGSYQEIARAFIVAFRHMGISAEMAPRDTRVSRGGVTSCFASPSAFEIVVDGRKLLGSAQKRTRSRVLQHGSLLIDYQSSHWGELMLRSQGIESDRVTDLQSEIESSIDLSQIKSAIIRGFSEYFGVTMTNLELTEDQRAEIEETARKNYSNLVGHLDSKQG